jgi:hypothetical protein
MLARDPPIGRRRQPSSILGLSEDGHHAPARTASPCRAHINTRGSKGSRELFVLGLPNASLGIKRGCATRALSSVLRTEDELPLRWRDGGLRGWSGWVRRRTGATIQTIAACLLEALAC